MKQALYLLVLTVFLSSCLTVPVERPQGPATLISQENAHELFARTVRLRVGLKSSTTLRSSGSATVVQELKTADGWEYVIITAAHVINLPGGYSTIEVEVDERDDQGWIKKIISKNITGSHIVRASDLYDIAVLKFLVDSKLPVRVSSIAGIAEMAETTPGSQIYGAGCSFGHGCMIHVGTLTSRIKDPRSPVISWNVASINWDSGSSGGGIYNANLGLIGVISAKQGSGVGLYVPLTTTFFDKHGASTFLEVLNQFFNLSFSLPEPEVKEPKPAKI